MIPVMATRAPHALKLVMRWCAARGIAVTFDDVRCKGEYEHKTKTIRINRRQVPETKLYTLLHECGHNLVTVNDRARRFRAWEQYDINSSTVIIIDLDEEFEAWHRGQKLAKRLGIRLNTQKWDRYRAKCIKAHMQWRLTPEQFDKRSR